MNESIAYIIRLLTGDEFGDSWKLIGYTDDPSEYPNYKIVINPSGFFDDSRYGTTESLPVLPLKQWEDVPILFGENLTRKEGDTIILDADLVAGTFFLITRYEEMVRKTIRDAHGRFPGKESLPYRAGFIDRPLIEEWGKLLRSLMRECGINIEEPPKSIRKVYLTHDVDQLAHYRRTRGMLGGLLRGLRWKKERKMALKSYFAGVIFDPWYTFPFLYRIDNQLKQQLGENRCEVITFIRAGGGRKKEDQPKANLAHPDYRQLLKYSKRKNIPIGLHTSYDAGINPALISREKKNLENFTGSTVTYNRNHFLNNREPADMTYLVDAGITEDFSMGYADIAGFRLGTCRPVQWINPENKQLTSLTLHSLTIMDVTLSEKRYMFMNAHDAYQYCISLIETVKNFNGELCLLWHNNTVEKSVVSYHRKLYQDLLEYLNEV